MTLKGDLQSMMPGDDTAQKFGDKSAYKELMPLFAGLTEGQEITRPVEGTRWRQLEELNLEQVTENLPAEIEKLINADGQKRKVQSVWLDLLEGKYACLQMNTEGSVGARLLIRTARYAEENYLKGGLVQIQVVGVRSPEAELENPEVFEQVEEMLNAKAQEELIGVVRAAVGVIKAAQLSDQAEAKKAE